MSARRMEGCSQSINKIFADEIINYFLLSWDIEIQVTFAIVCMTILVNISLLFAIMITGNVEKFCSSLEMIRGLARGLMLLSITVEASKICTTLQTPFNASSHFGFLCWISEFRSNKVFYRVFAVL